MMIKIFKVMMRLKDRTQVLKVKEAMGFVINEICRFKKVNSSMKMVFRKTMKLRIHLL